MADFYGNRQHHSLNVASHQPPSFQAILTNQCHDIIVIFKLISPHSMITQCVQRVNFQFINLGFSINPRFIPCHSAILASRFMASDSPSISSFASFDTETFLKQSLGAPSWQMKRHNSESGRSCVHLVCQQKNDERYVFPVPVSPCSSEVRLFPDLFHGSADLHPQIYTYQHHIPTQTK